MILCGACVVRLCCAVRCAVCRHNLNHVSLLPGSQSLLTFLGDPQSSVYEALPDATVSAALMKRLREQHPQAHIPPPSDFFISRHGEFN